MRQLALFSLCCTGPALAFAGDGDNTEPAVIILLVLGMVALIAGLSSLGDLRRKPFMPPRPGRRMKHDLEPDDGDEEHQPTPQG